MHRAIQNISMEFISVFDMLKVGIGPSSSHTLGPWKAALLFIDELKRTHPDHERMESLAVDLYGSLALTGVGHGTDFAVVLGLMGYNPETVPLDRVAVVPNMIRNSGRILFNGTTKVPFDYEKDIRFHKDESLDFHPNGLSFTANIDGVEFTRTYFSVGGGFVVKENEESPIEGMDDEQVPFPFEDAETLKKHCHAQDTYIWDIAMRNELSVRDKVDIEQRLYVIWMEMLQSVYRGCHTRGTLPGGLNVTRRASELYISLGGDLLEYDEVESWLGELRKLDIKFEQTVKWISCFALAVNEENAAYSRIVTAPTNGAAGVIPAVMLYAVAFARPDAGLEDIYRFMLTAAVIGGLFKTGSTISAAMGGCQAEIGVSSAMAAAALTEFLGGSADQAMVASEIAMEHHLGLTCDPVKGLVQIPCIERNTMGAMKAITAAHMALETNPDNTKVTLDEVIRTMWETARDMNSKYKETSLGGLATNIAVNLPEC